MDSSGLPSEGLAPVSTAQAVPLSSAERELRVMRYREKKQRRKYEKTIRYASRKAYAEIRPRIKGRFVTKEELEAWMEQKDSFLEAALVPDAAA